MSGTETQRQTHPLLKGNRWVPVIDTIAVGTFASVVGTQTNLLAGYTYYVFSEPKQFDWAIYGLNASWALDAGVFLTIADMGEEAAMMPRTGPASALLGEPNQALGGVMPLPLGFHPGPNGEPVFDAPYTLKAGNHLRFIVQNRGVLNISRTKITIVGARYWQGEHKP